MRVLSVAIPLVLLALPTALATSRKKVFVCEGSTLDLSCPTGTSLHLIRANYGRFSLSVCPTTSPSSSSWSTRCLQPTSLRQLTSECGGRTSCSLTVGSEVFGDPCPGTPKYLQLLYTCRRQEPTKATSMVPPWLLSMDQLQPSTSTAAPTTTTTVPPATELRNRFISYMEKIEAAREVAEVTRSRVNTLIEVEEEVIEQEIRNMEAVPFLGEEELAEQKMILMGVTISLMSFTIFLCAGLAIARHLRPNKAPPTIYYEELGYPALPPSPHYTPFLRPLPLPHPPVSSKPMEQQVVSLEEYDYIDLPAKLTHI